MDQRAGIFCIYWYKTSAASSEQNGSQNANSIKQQCFLWLQQGSLLLQGRDSWDLVVTPYVTLGKILHILMPQLAGKSVEVLINMGETWRELSEKHNFVIITFPFGLVDTSLAPIVQIPNMPVLKKIKRVLYKVRVLLQIIESSPGDYWKKQSGLPERSNQDSHLPSVPVLPCSHAFLSASWAGSAHLPTPKHGSREQTCLRSWDRVQQEHNSKELVWGGTGDGSSTLVAVSSPCPI